MKSSVISSVAGDEYSLEGIKVREVVKSSTFLPVPSGTWFKRFQVLFAMDSLYHRFRMLPCR
uniref:Uncharacterized protein n=1 Tax=Physcomitrium patens TaxID=3218 RepID=A0A7I4BH20_PHYPA